MPSHRQVGSRDSFIVEYSIRKNGIEVTNVTPKIVATGNMVVKNGIATMGSSGQGVLTVSYMGKSATQIVKINNRVEPSIVMMITGDERMRVGRESEYFVNTKDDTIFSLEENNDLASIEVINGQRCKIKANNDNKLGVIKLKATTTTQTAYKDIEIVSLWQVI